MYCISGTLYDVACSVDENSLDVTFLVSFNLSYSMKWQQHQQQLTGDNERGRETRGEILCKFEDGGFELMQPQGQIWLMPQIGAISVRV